MSNLPKVIRDLHNRITELEKELDFTYEKAIKDIKAHNLRQQAKGLEDYVNARALVLKDSPWFADDPPTIEYLYAAGFGIGESQQALQYADNLNQQASMFNE